MSLLERSNLTNTNFNKIDNGTNLHNQSNNTLSNEDNDLNVLYKQVQEIIPPERLVSYIENNPNRAYIELKDCANRCLQDDIWDSADRHYKNRMIKKLINTVFGFGPIESLLENPDITEVMVNGTNSIFFEKDGKLHLYNQRFSSEEQIRSLVDRILGPLGRRVDESSPMVNARLSSGHRVNVIVPPLSLNGTVMTIRKFSEHVMDLNELLKKGTIDWKIKKFLIWAIKLKKNIAVSGGTGSGKTTLLNAMSCEIDKSERIITIEDSAELRFLNHPHVISLEARPINAEGKGEITIRDLVINALRMRPDRIVVGECRAGEALDMLQAMNTGHDGSLTTLHANSPSETITRLTTMVRYVVDLPAEVIESYIASAIDIVIQISRDPNGNRIITDIVSFTYNKDTKRCDISQIYFRSIFESCGKWMSVPDWIQLIKKTKIDDEKEVNKWLNQI